MAGQRKGLGKGLAALIPTGDSEPENQIDNLIPEDELEEDRTVEVPSLDSLGKQSTRIVDAVFGAPGPADNSSGLVDVPGAQFAEVDVESIIPNEQNPRNIFDEDEMDELVHSVKTVGVLQPIVVRPKPDERGSYELIMGERRWRAVQQAGMKTIPAIVRNTSDDNRLRDALLENLHRSNLNPLEEAAAYQQLLDDFGGTHDELADRLGRSRPQVTNMLRLLKLPPTVQRRVAAGVLSTGHARALLGLQETAEMEQMAQRVVSEQMSVRATEDAVATTGGVDRQKKKTKPRAGAKSPILDEYTHQLIELLDTPVKIALGQKKGTISIDFASLEDLKRIVNIIE